MGSWNVNVVFPQENKAWMMVLLQVIYVEKKKKIIYAVKAQATKQIMNLTLRPTLHGRKSHVEAFTSRWDQM